MTISISGLSLVNTPRASPSPFTTPIFPNLAVTDTASQNVTLTVTQTNYLHTDPGATDDQLIPIGAGTFSEPLYNPFSNSANPVTFNGDGSVVVAGSLSGPTSYTLATSGPPYYTPVNAAYSPLAELKALTYAPPAKALSNNQVLETDFTVTATGDAGGTATSTEKVITTNPIAVGFTQYSSSAPVGSQAQPFSLIVGSPASAGGITTYGTSGVVTVSVAQQSELHTDPGAADDRVAALGLGTWGAFDPIKYAGFAGNPTNPPTVNNAGTITAIGNLSDSGQGTFDPTTGTYTAHEYSPATEISSSAFAPPAIPLTGNQVVRTTFTATVTDSLGDTSTNTTRYTYTNPTLFNVTSTVASSSPKSVTAAAAPAFTLSPPFASYTSALTGTIVVTQHNVIHTDPGAADDQVIAVGPGKFTQFTGNYGAPLNVPTIDNATGTVTASGALNAQDYGIYNPATMQISTAPHTYTPNFELSNMAFTPPAVTLTGNEVLETDFTFAVSDTQGDTSTAATSAFFKAATTATPTPTPTPGSGSGTAPGASTPITSDNTSAVYRFFDKTDGTHFFTASASERDNIISSRQDMVEETNGFGAVSASTPNAVAVYRFFDTVHGTHFFTSSASERDTVQATRSDLTYEPSATFYELSSNAGSDVAVYRLFDSKLGTHFYTGDPQEYAGITTPGSASYRADLKPEGVSFYAPAGSYT